MTNVLLAIISVLLFARIVLQVRQAKRGIDKLYCAPCEVEYHTDICADDIFELSERVRNLGKDNWELVTIIPVDVSGKKCYTIFFIRKKIKNYLIH